MPKKGKNGGGTCVIWRWEGDWGGEDTEEGGGMSWGQESTKTNAIVTPNTLFFQAQPHTGPVCTHSQVQGWQHHPTRQVPLMRFKHTFVFILRPWALSFLLPPVQALCFSGQNLSFSAPNIEVWHGPFLPHMRLTLNYKSLVGNRNWALKPKIIMKNFFFFLILTCNKIPNPDQKTVHWIHTESREPSYHCRRADGHRTREVAVFCWDLQCTGTLAGRPACDQYTRSSLDELCPSSLAGFGTCLQRTMLGLVHYCIADIILAILIIFRQDFLISILC
jgi:hypothetical protein